MFGFTLTRNKKTTPADTLVTVPTARENVKVENKGNTFIHVQNLVANLQGNRAMTQPVGREVVDGKWYTLFIRTDRETGKPCVDKKGNIILNRK